jgi:broad specificity phosphatase PhoE
MGAQSPLSHTLQAAIARNALTDCRNWIGWWCEDVAAGGAPSLDSLNDIQDRVSRALAALDQAESGEAARPARPRTAELVE